MLPLSWGQKSTGTAETWPFGQANALPGREKPAQRHGMCSCAEWDTRKPTAKRVEVSAPKSSRNSGRFGLLCCQGAPASLRGSAVPQAACPLPVPKARAIHQTMCPGVSPAPCVHGAGTARTHTDRQRQGPLHCRAQVSGPGRAGTTAAASLQCQRDETAALAAQPSPQPPPGAAR